MAQLSIFDMMYPKYKITKPIRLIELFAGYGSQALALKYLGVKFEHWKICEWAIKSIQAYKDLHFPKVRNLFMYSNPTTTKNKDVLINELYELGISSNYNEPMSLKQISKLSEEKIKEIYSNIVITNNLVNIQQVHAKDLEIDDIKEYTYLMTYSFPCQDLSIAGKGKGMSDTSTRSGMLWEVERILNECKKIGNLPEILLMENVPQVHSQDNVQDFNKWQLRLEELGYKNYFQDLIATDYGIPQTRNRCFMISILGNYNYSFPKPISLKLKLKDMLEVDVDKKYYISDALTKYITRNYEVKPKNNFNVIDSYNKKLTNQNVSGCIVAGQGRNQGSMIMEVIPYGTYYTWKDLKGNINTQCCRAADENRNALTIACANTGNVLLQKECRIRKLTPKECFRLMGVKDEDFELIERNQSDSSLYHLAGDSIVVNVLMAIFKELL